MQADARCVLEEDAGFTKADKIDKTSKCVGHLTLLGHTARRSWPPPTHPSIQRAPTDRPPLLISYHRQPTRFFCIHFARGMCARGHECQYFHRVPTLQDDAIAGQLHDCFGRRRMRMGGMARMGALGLSSCGWDGPRRGPGLRR